MHMGICMTMLVTLCNKGLSKAEALLTAGINSMTDPLQAKL